MDRQTLKKVLSGTISGRYVDFIFSQQRRPSPDVARALERATGIDRRAWLWPDEFPNPYIDTHTSARSVAVKVEKVEMEEKTA
jgi:hypothetical protein